MIGTEEWVEVGEVTSLHIYPIKSCKGQAQESMKLDEYGAVNDRRYMIVDENGRFVTQRQEAALCQIVPAVRWKSPSQNLLSCRSFADPPRRLAKGRGSWYDSMHSEDHQENECRCPPSSSSWSPRSSLATPFPWYPCLPSQLTCL